MIVVCGFGRCGSSLLMQMLAAGGIPCLGKFPMFEDSRLSAINWSNSWIIEAQDKNMAVKLLNPHLYQKDLPRELPAKYIWLDRDIDQQAKSWEKLRKGLVGLPEEAARKTLSAARAKKKMLKNRSKALGVIKDRGEVLCLTFEQILAAPPIIAEVLQAYTGREMDADRMVQAVIPRSADCLPHLLEAEFHKDKEILDG